MSWFNMRQTMPAFSASEVPDEAVRHFATGYMNRSHTASQDLGQRLHHSTHVREHAVCDRHMSDYGAEHYPSTATSLNETTF